MSDLYMAWALRFVPDPARGEFINFGVLAGRDGDDWAVRTANDLSRARCISSVQPTPNTLLQRILPHADLMINGERQPVPDPSLDVYEKSPLTVESVRHLSQHSYNVLQFSPEIPSVGTNADAVAVSLYDHLVVDPNHASRPQPRTRLRRAVRALIEQAAIDTSSVRRDVRLKSQNAYETVDFTFGDNAPVKLTHCLTFARTDANASRQQADTWSFFIQGLRERGAHFSVGTGRAERQITVPRDVEVSIVFDPPSGPTQIEALRAAQDGWTRVGINGFEIEQANRDLTETAHLLDA